MASDVTRGLTGARVAVTRARTQASKLATQLRARGATPIEAPTIEIVDPADGGAALAERATGGTGWDWVVVTSPNGAHRFVAALGSSPRPRRLAAIGPATAAVLEAAGLVVDLLPTRHVAEGLLEVFPPPGAGAGRRLLLPQAGAARPVLRDGLAGLGWDVDAVEAYRTVAPEITDAQRRAVATADAITFTSSSTVTNFLASYGRDVLPPIVASIGPITSETARMAGISVTIEADPHTIDGLVSALEQALEH